MTGNCPVPQVPSHCNFDAALKLRGESFTAAGLIRARRQMTSIGALKSMPDVELSQLYESFKIRLTDEQFECLSRCAKGISLRFEASEIVDALVAGGYSEVGVARVVTMTAKGHLYLQMHRAESRPKYRQAMRRGMFT